jgi:predicted nucleic acid-binding protein
MINDYLADTNFASCLFVTSRQEHPKAKAFSEKVSAAGGRIYLSRIAIGEVEFGLALKPSISPTTKQQMKEGIRTFQVKEIAKHTTPIYGQIRAALYDKKCPRDIKNRVKVHLRPECFTAPAMTPTAYELGIQENDLWMAAIAVRYNMGLISEDRMRQIKDVWPALNLVPWR